MPSRLVQYASILLGAATLLWLGYGIGRTVSIRAVAQLQRDADVERYSLSQDGTVVSFERLGGGGKPRLFTADGLELLDLSEWDPDSRVVVDGTAFELVKLYPRSSVDYGRNRIAEGLYGDGWLLEREISLDESGVVHVQHSFVARRPIHRVDLLLAHVHLYFITVQTSTEGVTASVNRVNQDQAGSGKDLPIAYRLRIVGEGGQHPPTFRVGQVNPIGPSSFVAQFSVDAPEIDQRTVLGGETIRVEPLR